MYIPKTKFIYPTQSDTHMLHVTPKYHDVLDKNYDFVKKGRAFKFKRFFFNILWYGLALPVARIRYMVKVEGKKKLKQYKKIAKKEGIITTSNHVFVWDYLVLRSIVRFPKPKVLIWEKNNTAGLSRMYHLAGCVPITSNVNGFKKLYRDIDQLLAEKNWLHIYAEEAMFYYYVPIREFKKGTFLFSYKHNIPVLPISYSYREPKGIFKYLRRNPFVTMHIGDLVYPDTTIDRSEAIEKQKNEARMQMIKMCGIGTLEENERIAREYYTYEDGHTYKNM